MRVDALLNVLHGYENGDVELGEVVQAILDWLKEWADAASS